MKLRGLMRFEQVEYSFAIRFCVLLFFLYSSYLNLTSPLTDLHGFRQAQTAVTILESKISFADGVNIQTPLLGAPWQVPMEYPIYQLIAMSVGELLNINKMMIAKIVGLISYIGSYFILSSLISRGSTRLIFYTAFFSSPLLLSFNSKVLIESFSFFLMALVFRSFIALVKGANGYIFMIYSASVALAGLQKITGLLAVSLACGVVFFVSVWFGRLTITTILKIFIATALGIVLPLLWLYESGQTKESTYLLEFLSAESLFYWNFGLFEQRLDPYSWVVVLFRLVVLGGALPLLLLGVFRFVGTKQIVSSSVTWGSLCVAVISPVIFFNLYLVHDYYFVAVVGLLIFGISCLFYEYEHPRKLFRDCSIILIVNLTVFFSWYQPQLGKTAASHDLMEDVGHRLHGAVSANGYMLGVGMDWDATVPLLIDADALMIPSWPISQTSPSLKGEAFDPFKVLGNLELYSGGKNLELIVICPIRPAEYFYAVRKYVLELDNFRWTRYKTCDIGRSP